MTAAEAAHAIARGFDRAYGEGVSTLCPMADGGEGTVQAFVDGGARRETVRVRGPLGDAVDAAYALQGDSAIIELASSSGLALVPPERRDIMHANTAGFGEVIRAVMERRVRRIVAGIGGSATNDVGTGMLRSLGTRFLDRESKPIEGPMTAFELLASIDLTHFEMRKTRVAFDVASDVDSPLTGEQGAAAVFASQKGATAAQIAQLETIANRIADVTAAAVGRDVRGERGAGAAGGVGFALLAFFRAHMHRGVDLIARERGLTRLLDGASLCATGEGKIDMQTLRGKTVAGVAQLARERGVSVIAFAGKVEDDARVALGERGVEVRQTAPAMMDAAQAMGRAAELLERAAYEYAVERR
ncbi:MAG: glycerate kinase [Candidatus Eremiobacteraeota bacterium]|nr:glycerate kinase [Candidatus Eremiobacteraeota bacterium]